MPETARLSASVPSSFYLAGGVIAAALGLLAMFVAYQILGSEAWVDTLDGNLVSVPAALFDVSLVKAFEVILAVLAAHALLKFARVDRREPSVPIAFALFVLAMSVIGFLASYNNAPSPGFAGAEAGPAASDNAGTVDTLFASLKEPRRTQEAAIAPALSSAPAFDAPHNGGPASILFAGAIFVAIVLIAALYLQLAESCFRTMRFNADSVLASP